MEMPSALTMTREAIKYHPELLKPGLETEMLLSELMIDFREQANKYVTQDRPIIDEIKNRLQELNNL